MPEELIFEQVLRLGGAVQGHETALGARRETVHRRGDELLAGAALAEDQHGHGRGGDDAHLVDHAAHGLARRDQTLEALVAAVRRGFGRRRAVPQQHRACGPVDEAAEDLQVEGLLDEVVRALLEGGPGGGHVSVGGHHHGLGLGLESACRFEDAKARVSAVWGDGPGGRLRPGGGGHPQVGDDDVERAVLEFVERGGNPVDHGADVPGPLERIGHHLGMVRLVVDDQHLRSGFLHLCSVPV